MTDRPVPWSAVLGDEWKAKDGGMTGERVNQFRWLEGRQVSLALTDGSRIDDCQLISAGRSGVSSLWLFTNGTDVFVALDNVVEVWEAVGGRSRAA
jgi:hypothetical protein